MGYDPQGYAAGGYRPPYPTLPPLAEWFPRVGASVIDSIVPTVAIGIAYAVFIASFVTSAATASTTATSTLTNEQATRVMTGSVLPGLVAMLIGLGVSLGFVIWNRGYLQGRTGQSLGKRALGIRLLNETTMAPPGMGWSLLRELAHYLDGAVMDLGYLWPLWDDKKQTFADKLLHTVVVVDG